MWTSGDPYSERPRAVSRYFEWLKDNHKVTVAALLVAVVGVLVATLAFGRDVFGIELAGNGSTSGGSTAVVTSTAPGTLAPTPSPTTPAPTDSPTGEPTPTASESVDVTPDPTELSPSPQPGIRYLDELSAEDRNGGYRRGLVTMAGQTYDRSVQFSCNGNSTYFVYPVAGTATLDFWLGIDDNTARASGRAADLTFYADNGRQIGSRQTARLGPAVKVQVDLEGVTQLKIRCVGRDVTSGAQKDVAHVAFGEATLSSVDIE